MIHLLAQHQPLDQWRNVVELSLMSQYSDIAGLDVDLLGTQVVENDREQLWITIDEDGIRFVTEAGNAAISLGVKQGSEERIRDPC